MTRTTSIDLAAAYFAVSGQAPQICTDQSGLLKTFEIPENETTQKLFTEFATGNLTLNVKKFASCRALLFKKIKGVKA